MTSSACGQTVTERRSASAGVYSGAAPPFQTASSSDAVFITACFSMEVQASAVGTLTPSLAENSPSVTVAVLSMLPPMSSAVTV